MFLVLVLPLVVVSVAVSFITGCQEDSSVCSDLQGSSEVDEGRSSANFPHRSFLEGASQVDRYPGHYPSSLCRITNVYLDSRQRVFRVGVDDLSRLEICFGTWNMWDFSTKAAAATNLTSRPQHPGFVCDQVFRTGYVFSTYYYHGSNYFHLHYDTALPLYRLLHHNGPGDDHHHYSRNKNEILFMPSVELQRGLGTDWNTDAFLDELAYWNKMIGALTLPHKVLPLDRRLAATEKNLCFDEIYFGTPKFDAGDPELVTEFVSFVKSRLNVSRSGVAASTRASKSVGLIRRTGRRRILNEEQLISALGGVADIQLVNFSGMPLEKQIEEVQRYDVLVGMNGAGLVNALYLPSTGVAVQLVPYMAQLNHQEYANLLRSRGPYLDWHNSHVGLTRPAVGDPFNNNPDTIVHIPEFVALIKEALKLSTSTSSLFERISG